MSRVRNTATYEEDIIADNSSIPHKLGGNRTDQLISARESSVVAAYNRLANVSPNKLGGFELNQELDPGYSSHSLSEEKSDCVISASNGIEDIEMAITDKKEHRGEPDPDDHIINGKYEPDPDDSHHGKLLIMMLVQESLISRILNNNLMILVYCKVCIMSQVLAIC